MYSYQRKKAFSLFNHTGHSFHVLNSLGNILIDGQLIKRKPLFGVTMGLWLKLDTNRGEQTIFSTCNPDNPWNSNVQYSFEIVDGRVKWFHKNEKSQVSLVDNCERWLPADRPIYTSV